jgi:ribonuclease HI
MAELNEVLTLEFDGGSRGNPGPAGIGVVVRAADGTPVVTLGRFIGKATNNVAEYRALITALEEAKKLGARQVYIRGDSELIIKQMKGIYRVKHPDMKVLYDEAKSVLSAFDGYKIDHNLRHKNELADKLANLAMDRKGDVTDPGTGSSNGASRSDAESSPLDLPSPEGPKAGDLFACARCGCTVELKKPSSIRPHQLRPFVCQCGNPLRAPRED